MKISVNLATRPFVELRPLFARLRLAMGLLALLAVALGFGLHALNAKARAAQAKMDAVKAKTLGFENERLANEAKMRQPQNRGVLERSQFLNTLFAEKSFSWTAVMMDLEKVLPTGVQVTNLTPEMGKDGTVSIHLRVSGERSKTVQFVRNLETSQRFISPRLQAAQAQAQETGRANVVPVAGPGAVEFEILSDYNPLPELPKKILMKESTEPGAKTPGVKRPSTSAKKKTTKPATSAAKRPGGVR